MIQLQNLNRKQTIFSLFQFTLIQVSVHQPPSNIMPVVTAAFKAWLKASTNIKLSSDAAVTRITHEGITNFESLLDFDKKSLQLLPSICKEKVLAIPEDADNNVAAEPEVAGANISSISVQRLIVAANAASYYSSIDRVMTTANMHYINVLMHFKHEWEAYQDLKEKDDPKVPKINDRDVDRKIIRWVPIFKDAMSRTYGSKGPLSYILRDDPAVPDELSDPLQANANGNVVSYFGRSGSLLEELIHRLPHSGPIFKNDNASVFGKIEEAARGTSVESTIKSFTRSKDGRGAFAALVANHAGEAKYRSIMKRRMNHLQNIKWNGRSYPLESHVSNHRQAFDDLRDCAQHITVQVPTEPQRVEYLIDSIACSDSTLQAAIGLVRANTNQMRENFERAASSLIEVDPYRRSHRVTPSNNKTANVSAIDFSAGRGTTGVDLRWYPRKEFLNLPQNQKSELMEWMKTDSGRELVAKYRSERDRTQNNRSSNSRSKRKDGGNSNNSNNWKKKLKKAIKTENGLKSVMSVLSNEEASHAPLVAALKSQINNLNLNSDSKNSSKFDSNVGALSVTSPATSIRLQSILKSKK